jgi:hypothetical protein
MCENGPERKKPAVEAAGKDHFKSGEREKLVPTIGCLIRTLFYSYNCLPS